MPFPLVIGKAFEDLSSLSNSSAQSAQRHFSAQLTGFVYLQTCNYVLLSAPHIDLLRGSLQSVCHGIAFKCHFVVILLFP